VSSKKRNLESDFFFLPSWREPASGTPKNVEMSKAHDNPDVGRVMSFFVKRLGISTS
jgi:hypothetical protein